MKININIIPIDKTSIIYMLILSAVMSMLFAVALIIFTVVNDFSRKWTEELHEIVTVFVFPKEEQIEPEIEDKSDKDIEEIAAAILREMPGVSYAKIISDEKKIALLKPWLGNNEEIERIPLPGLIEVRYPSGVLLEHEKVIERLDALGIKADIGGRSFLVDNVKKLVTWGLALSAFLLTVSVLASMLAVSLVCKNGVTLRKSLIETLIILGASNKYIKNMFVRRCLISTFIGSVVGVFLVFVISGLDPFGILPYNSVLKDIPGWDTPRIQLIYFAAIPFILGFVAKMTSNLYVSLILKRGVFL